MKTAEENDVAPIVQQLGFKLIRAKTNFGLGRITNPEFTPATAKAAVTEIRAVQAGAGHDYKSTFYRFGTTESFRDDIVIFAVITVGKNDKDSVPKSEKRSLEMALKYNPVNLGDSAHGRRTAAEAAHA